MAQIDVKFMRGNKKTLKAMSTTYGKKSTGKKTVKRGRK